MRKYGVIVIGAGAAGLNIAGFMNTAGFSVLLIDKSDRDIGGDCLNFGCVPSKAFIHAARVVYEAKKAQKFGIKTIGTGDLAKVAAYVDEKIEYIRKHENADYFGKKGMDVVLGFAKFSGKNSVIVNGKEYFGKKIVLATGASPRKLDVPGVEKVCVHTNESIFDLKHLPKKLLIVGGGPVGMEIGQSFARLGSEVTMLIRGKQFLPREDPEIAEVLRKELEKEGVRFLFDTEVSKFSDAHTARIKKMGAKKEQTLTFDELFVSIGRTLNVGGLDLEKAGVKMNSKNRKLLVNKYLQTTNKNVLVCGDVAGGPMFTHAAEVQAAVIIKNFFSPFKTKINYDHFAWVTYTDPEIASFGLQEKDLQARKLQYEVLDYTFEHDDRAIVDDVHFGRAKYFVNKKGKILGGTMVAKNAGELVQEMILANTHGLKVGHIFGRVYPYPTAARVNKYTLRPFYARKLTSFAKKVMHWMYR